MDGTVNIDDVRARDEVGRLLEDTWSERSRMPRRRLIVEVLAAVAFLIVAGALATLSRPADWNIPVLLGLVACYAALSRVEFPIGRAYMVPTQLVLVPMLFAAPPGAVPLLVAGGLALGALADWLSGRGPAERIVSSGADAWHAIGPAVVLLAAGQPPAGIPALEILALALAAQCALDTASAVVREWCGAGTPPRLQLRVLAQIAFVDALLTPVGFLAAHLGRHDAIGFFLAVPPGVLLFLLARDRTARIHQAQERLEAVRRERVRLQRAIQRIGEAFASTLDFDAVLETTLHASVEAAGADGGRTSMLRGGRPGVAPHQSAGELGPLLAALDAAEGQVLLTGDPAERRHGDVTALAWPVGGQADEDTQGRAAVIAVARTGEPFHPFEHSLLSYLVTQANVSVENIALHEQLGRQAATDALTGLDNRRRFEEHLDEGIARHRRDRTPVALVLLDIDDFKRVNDTHGHQAGDGVLRACARALRTTCRAGDAPARYGGEELAVVLTGVTEREAADFAERVRQAVAAASVPAAPGEQVRVTASLGVACLGGEVDDAAALLAAADRALYAAKRAGKDRVVLANDAVALPAADAARP